jgi:hypothetical protein
MPETADPVWFWFFCRCIGYGVYDPIENQCYGDAFDGSIRPIGRPAPFNTYGVADSGSVYSVPYTALPDEKRKFWNTGLTNQTDILSLQAIST